MTFIKYKVASIIVGILVIILELFTLAVGRIHWFDLINLTVLIIWVIRIRIDVKSLLNYPFYRKEIIIPNVYLKSIVSLNSLYLPIIQNDERDKKRKPRKKI